MPDCQTRRGSYEEDHSCDCGNDDRRGDYKRPNCGDRYGCGVGAGIIGGLAAGAIIGGAIANSQPRYYAPPPGYVVYGGYGAPNPMACPGGYWARRPVAFDAYGEPVRWSRPRFICP